MLQGSQKHKEHKKRGLGAFTIKLEKLKTLAMEPLQILAHKEEDGHNFDLIFPFYSFIYQITKMPWRRFFQIFPMHVHFRPKFKKLVKLLIRTF